MPCTVSPLMDVQMQAGKPREPRNDGIEPVPDGVRLVVVALEQLPAAAIADALDAGRVEVDVPDVPAVAAGTTTGQPPDHLVVVDDELEYDVQRRTGGEQQVVERARLR